MDRWMNCKNVKDILASFSALKMKTNTTKKTQKIYREINKVVLMPKNCKNIIPFPEFVY